MAYSCYLSDHNFAHLNRLIVTMYLHPRITYPSGLVTVFDSLVSEVGQPPLHILAESPRLGTDLADPIPIGSDLRDNPAVARYRLFDLSTSPLE